MIDERSSKGFFLKAFCFARDSSYKDFLRKEGCCDSSPGCLASSVPPLTTPSGSLAMLVLRFPLLEDQII